MTTTDPYQSHSMSASSSFSASPSPSPEQTPAEALAALGDEIAKALGVETSERRRLLDELAKVASEVNVLYKPSRQSIVFYWTHDKVKVTVEWVLAIPLSVIAGLMGGLVASLRRFWLAITEAE